MTNKMSAFMAGGPLRKAIESTPKGIYAALIEMGAQEQRTWSPMSVAAPGWAMHYKDEVLMSAERDFVDLVAAIATDKDVLKQIRRNAEEGADVIMEKAKGTGTMDIDIVEVTKPKPRGKAQKPRRG